MKRNVMAEDDTTQFKPGTERLILPGPSGPAITFRVEPAIRSTSVQGEDVLRKETHAFPPNKLMLLGLNLMHNLDHQRKK
jgi:hypothetical protein